MNIKQNSEFEISKVYDIVLQSYRGLEDQSLCHNDRSCLVFLFFG